MRLGIDSYSFHRYFGEIYDEQADPGVRWTLAGDFLPYAVEQEVEEVALDLQFFPAVDTGYCDQLRAQLDDAGLDRVVGWGHPDGLHAGTSEEALLDLEQSIPIAPRVGARTMRIVSSSYIYVDEPHGPQIVRIVRMLKGAVEVARSHDVVLALENHIDFTSKEIVEIIERVDSEHLRVNFDTGNTLRVFEDPVAAAQRLGPYIVSTHMKDLTVHGRGGSPSDRFRWWRSCPVGRGLVDVPAVVSALADAGFEGALDVELDFPAPEYADRPEEELVTESLAYLRPLVARAETAVDLEER